MREHKRLMVDIETLDTAPTAVVLSVGVVDIDTLETVGYWRLDPTKQPGRTISAGTVVWWMQQSKEARDDVFGEQHVRENALHVVVVLAALFETAEELWANGTDFDFGILNNLMQSELHGYRFPFWKQRDYRTFKNVFKAHVPSTTVGTAHNALDDAKNQAIGLRAIEKALTNTGG